MAPGPRRRRRRPPAGSCPTDVWWHTIVPTDRRREDRLPDAEARGRAAAHRRRLAAAPGDWCLDFFAGSGTLGAVAARLGRRYVLIDSNPEAVRVMRAPAGRRRRRAGAGADGRRPGPGGARTAPARGARA